MSDSGASPRRLVLVRHGRTAWNAEGRAQGHADVELDDVGHAQASALAPLLARLAPSALWSSDLARARQTAAYVEKETGLSSRLDDRLREYDVGERTGLTPEEFAARSPLEHRAWQRRGHDAVDGAENDEEVRRRMVDACGELVASLAPGGTGVAVTHGAALRVAAAELLGWPDELRRSLRILDNCAAAVLEEDTAPGRWRLVAWGLAPDFASVGAAR